MWTAEWPSGLVRDVFDKDEAEHQVLVFGGIHVGAQIVGGGPESFLMSSSI